MIMMVMMVIMMLMMTMMMRMRVMVLNISGAVGFWRERSALGSDWSYSSNSLLTSPIAAPADCSPVASSLQIHCHQKNSPQDKNGFSDFHADPWMAGHRRWTWSPNGKGEWKWQQQLWTFFLLKTRAWQENTKNFNISERDLVQILPPVVNFEPLP